MLGVLLVFGNLALDGQDSSGGIYNSLPIGGLSGDSYF